MSGKRFIYLICCSAACLGLTLTACDDDPGDGDGDTTTDTSMADGTDTSGTDTNGTDTNGTDTNETDTNETDTTDTSMPDDTDTTETCEVTEAECAANGEILNADTCMCEVPPDVEGQCKPNEKDGTVECDPAVAQLASNVCANADGDDTTPPTCFQACESTDNCDEGSICDTDLGACIPSDCTNFFTNDCDAGNKCIPSVNQSYFCAPNGTAVEGADCEAHTDCDNGLLCVGTCEAPTCAPLTMTPACGTGEQCSGYSIGDEAIDVGQCVQLCNPFVRDATGAATDSCDDMAGGEYCQPLDTRDTTGAINGLCSPDPGGAVAAGGTCDGMSPATSCSQPASGNDPLICVGSTCEVICDPEDQATCPVDGQSCFPISLQFSDGTTFDPDWGLCSTTCTPTWDPDDAGTECEAGEYCWPDFDIAGVGRCFTEETGTARDGEACNVQDRSGCDDLHLCFTSEVDANDNPIAAECSLLCDPSAADGAAGSCADGANGQQRSCLALQVDDGMGNPVPLPVGTCNDTCDLTEDVLCADAADGSPRYCQIGELFGIPGVDLCTGGPATPLALNEDCTGKVDPGAFCKDNGFCIDLGDGSRCTEACYPAGTVDPPECSQSGMGTTISCNNPGFTDPQLGLCQL